MSVENSTVVWQGSTKDIEFSYTDFKGNKTRRKVEVKKVLFDKEKQQFYINGICQERNAERDFKEDNISTMIKVGSKRYYFTEWMWTLDIEVSDWLDHSDFDDQTDGEPGLIIGKQAERTTINLEDPEIQKLMKKVKDAGSEGDANKLKSPWPDAQPIKRTSSEVRAVTPLLGIGIFVMPFIFSWFTLRKSHTTKAKVIAFGWLLLTLLIGFSNPSKNSNANTIQEPAAREQVSSAFDGLSDCQLAGSILVDLKPISDSLINYANNNRASTAEHFNHWKKSSGFDLKREALTKKYPTQYRLDMVQSKAAIGLEFRLGQLSRDIHSQLRKSPSQPYKLTNQYHFLMDGWKAIGNACSEEWELSR